MKRKEGRRIFFLGWTKIILPELENCRLSKNTLESTPNFCQSETTSENTPEDTLFCLRRARSGELHLAQARLAE